MKTFTDRWQQLDWDDIRLRINSKTAADVERALNATQLSRDDMMALLSPRRQRLSGAVGPNVRSALPVSALAIPSAFMCRCISLICAPTTALTAAFQ
ncbi:thiamine biosynthesis protein [Citrobacter koseri]|uniref:Thiamine biosynthesis protein n=1 Tax=Citrobacter koseri TaxID=545 RepID=A0A2X2W6T8_CITKO|nr:thiamine biosynthesis protein [Citrobacter koseri]